MNITKALESSSISQKQPKKFVLKTPKGTKDYNDKEMSIRQSMFDTITTVFKAHGAVTIDTPVFELRDILSGKYGEDSKLIYDLEDQGGEICSLRYDLTVPFARFLAMNGNKYQQIKRYHIAKVYRRDQPSVARGRMREFYQCDFDIAGVYESMVPDADALRVMWEILNKVEVGEFVIKLNNRKILDGMFEACGVPTDKFRPISSAVDKLDKMSWTDVRKEMVEDKGLDPVVADKIEKYVKLSGSVELCDTLCADELLGKNASVMEGVAEIRSLLKYLGIMGVLPQISFDLSLARGLDYYTGVIYEAVITKSTVDVSGLGSIASGGRYDGLVSMFSTNSSNKIPCVGISIGVERLFAILLKKNKDLTKVRGSETEVYVCGIADGTLEERMKICGELWDAGIKAEFQYKSKVKLAQQFSICEREQIPLAVIVGTGEIEKGVVGIKDQREEKAVQVEVKREKMVSEIKRLLSI